MSRSSCARFPDHSIVDESHGGDLGTHCDGVLRSTNLGDQGGKKNGIVERKPLKPDATYVLDRTTTPRGDRPAPNKTITTVAGQNAAVTIKNRARR